MSPTSSHSEDSSRSSERRRFIRQRVRSLAYLDIVPNNGGIVLNLSENGLALQAVNPFDETRVSLRIQPPSSRKRIEANAEITWLSDSKTEAGLHFLELTEEARLEIADWIAAESGAGAQRPVYDSPAVPAPQIPQKPIAAEPTSVRQKWSAMLADSPSDVEPAHPQAPDDALDSRAPCDDLDSQPDASPLENLPAYAADIPASSSAVIRPPATNEESDVPVNLPTRSTPVSRVVKFPGPATHLPAADELLRDLSSPAPADLKSRPAEAPGTPVRLMHAKSLKFLAHRFRGPSAITALSACAAIIFLVIGIAITRQRPSASLTKLSAQEGPQVPHAAAPVPVASDTLSPGIVAPQSGAPHSQETRHAMVGASAASPHRENSKARDKKAHPRYRAGSSDSLVGKFSSPIRRVSLEPTSSSPETAIASAPALSIKPTSAPRMVADSLEINPPPPINLQRRSDCYLLYRVEPLYPREAKAHHIEGTVTIHLQIGTDGRVQTLQELSGPTLLVPAALDAAREWRFIPALLNGQAIEAEKDVSIVFQLSE